AQLGQRPCGGAVHRWRRAGERRGAQPAGSGRDPAGHGHPWTPFRRQHPQRLQWGRDDAHLPRRRACLSGFVEIAADRPGPRHPRHPGRQPGAGGGAVPHRGLPPARLRQLAHRDVADDRHPLRRAALDLLGQPLRDPGRSGRAGLMAPPKTPQRSWALLFIRNCLLWLLPAALLWALVTPFYNQFLLTSGENLVHLTESPNVTDLVRRDSDFAYVSRLDFPPSKSLVHSFRVTDVHFTLVMLIALFLAVPRLSWRRRLENLGWALLATVFFDIVLVFFRVKFV